LFLLFIDDTQTYQSIYMDDGSWMHADGNTREKVGTHIVHT